MKKGKNNIKIDYGIYELSFIEIVKNAAVGTGLGALVCWLAYDSIYSFPLAIAIAVIYFIFRKKELAEERRRTLLYHFKDFISALHVALRSGYSVENGIISATKDTELLYGSSDILVKELKNIIGKMKIQMTVEELFTELAGRSGLEDIQMFASLMVIAKRTGGSMSKMLGETRNIICDKIDTKKEIDEQLAEAAFEQKIMSLMPAGIIIYMRLTFSGFIEQLYGNIGGVIVMTGCLALYAASFIWGRKMVRIEV